MAEVWHIRGASCYAQEAQWLKSKQGNFVRLIFNRDHAVANTETSASHYSQPHSVRISFHNNRCAELHRLLHLLEIMAAFFMDCKRIFIVIYRFNRERRKLIKYMIF